MTGALLALGRPLLCALLAAIALALDGVVIR